MPPRRNALGVAFLSALQTGRLHWEIIPDGSVTDIIRSIETGVIIKIVTNEQLTVTVDDNKTVVVNRKRVFTREKIVERHGEAQQALQPTLKPQYTIIYAFQTSTRQPKNKNGRKPSQLKKYIKDNNMCREDVRSYNQKERAYSPRARMNVDMVQDKSEPMIVRIDGQGIS